MTRAFDTLASSDIDLGIKEDLSSQYKIRNGRLWALFKSRQLVYVDLNLRPKPQVHIFTHPHLCRCAQLFVSSDGGFCLVTVEGTVPYLIRSSNLVPFAVPVLPRNNVTTATFFQIGSVPIPHLFMGTDHGQIAFLDLKSRDLQRVSVVPVQLPNNSAIVGLSFISFVNGDIGLSVITAKQIHAFLLERDFTKIPSNPPMVPQLEGVQPRDIFTEGPFIGLMMGPILLAYLLPVGTDKPQLGNFYMTQRSYAVPADAVGYSLFDEFALAYNSTGDVFIFMGTQEGSEIAKHSVPGAQGFEYDTDSGELYAIFPRKLTRLRFDPTLKTRGSDSIRLWVFNHFMANKKEKEAIGVLSKVSLPFDELLKMVGRRDDWRLQLFQHLLADVRTKRIKSQRAIAIAVLAFDFYVRVELFKARPHVEEFCVFVTGLIQDGLIDMATVTKILSDYGWESPLEVLADQVTLFNKYLESRIYDMAVVQMNRINDDRAFCRAALRIFPHMPKDVARALDKRESVDNVKLAPILISEECRPLVFKLLQTGRLTKPWLRRLYSLVVSRNPTEELIEPFFTRFQYSSDLDVPAMVRCLAAEKQFIMLAVGLRANHQIVGAVAAAAMGDPVSAFDVIPQTEGPEVKKRCAIRILRSLTRTNAEKVARRLVESYAGAGVDVPTLLQFIPDDLPVAQLAVVLAEFTKTKRETAAEQRRSFDGSKNGILRAQKLQAEHAPFVSSLSSTEPCEKCKTPLFAQPGIVYPCGHVLHLKCAEKIAKLLPAAPGDKPLRLDDDCPFCGFLSVRMLAAPFVKPVSESGIDPWTVNLEDLLRAADDSRWKLIPRLKL
jgi:hypothetical protein